MIAEYRNNMYIVSGFQLSEISTIVDVLTVVRHALCGESVSREVIEAARLHKALWEIPLIISLNTRKQKSI